MAKHTCDQCEASYSTLRELLHHRSSEGHLHTCGTCHKKFAQKKNLTRHKKRHFEQHNCPDCSKVFNTTFNLERHRASHQVGGKRKLPTSSESTKRFKEDDPKAYYDLQKVGEAVHPKYNTTSSTYRVSFKDIEVEGIPNILKALKLIFRAIIEELASATSDNDLIRMSVQNPEFDYPIELPFKRKRHLTADSILYEIERVLQSYEEFRLDSGLELNIIHVKMPIGRGRRYKMNYVNLQKSLQEKRCFIQIKNRDSLCCARAIVTAVSRLEKPDNWSSIRQGGAVQGVLATELHKKAGVPVGECGIEEVKKFQLVLPNYQLNVFAMDVAALVYSGPENGNKIFLLYHNNHYDVITSMPAFLGNSFYCEICKKGYNNRDQHKCNNPCYRCKSIHEDNGELIQCSDCFRWFDGNICFAFHKKTTNAGRSTCKWIYICRDCGCTVNKDMHKNRNGHRCGNIYCKLCKNWYPADHRCYMKVDKPTGKQANDLEEDICEDRTPSEKDQLKNQKYIFFDFECKQETVFQCPEGFSPNEGNMCKNCKKKTCGALKHEPNLCIAHRVCEHCADSPISPESECSVCGKQEHVFFGDDARDQFCNWLFSVENKGTIVLAHNFRGYDSLPILEYLHKNGIIPEVIAQGSKNLCITVKQCKMKMIDSLSFLNTRLANLPKMFGIQELRKGYYPHLWNKKENEGKVLDSLPSVKYYNCDAMKDDERRTFLKWYEDNRHSRFDSDMELLSYCRSDVDILRRCCMAFRKLFMQLTCSRNDDGIDPFQSCITIASACMKTYRRKFLKPNAIALIPLHGYGGRDKQSIKALQWIKYIADKDDRKIQHALNGREFQVGPFKLDGYYQTEEGERVAMEFLGCFWHGCPKCFARTAVNPVNTKGMDVLHNEVLDREQALSKAGFTPLFVWECDWNTMVAESDDIRNFVESLEMVSPLEPREAFFGGRTEAFTLHADSDSNRSIKYYDVTSLYPFINKTGKYVVGHPEVITENFGDLDSYEGLIKCKVVPPRRLFMPVLPQKINGKLLFALCKTCANTQQASACMHSEDERAFTGTWVTDEVKKAISKGYIITQIYEVWHWCGVEQYDPDTKTGGLFTEYVNTFLQVLHYVSTALIYHDLVFSSVLYHMRSSCCVINYNRLCCQIKQENSGWPSWCVNDTGKQKYIKDYFEKEGILLNHNKIEKNPGLRSLAKLMLNR